MLPTSRNLSLPPGTPIPGTVIQDLEDCTIGKKFKSTPFYVPGTGFRLIAGAPTLDTDGLWTMQTGVADELSYPLEGWPWMAGTRITALVWSFNRNSNDASGEFQWRLKRRAFSAAPSDIFSGVSSSGTGFTSRDSIASDLAGVPYTLLDGYMYWLSVKTATAFSGAPKFDGAKIVADRL